MGAACSGHEAQQVEKVEPAKAVMPEEQDQAHQPGPEPEVPKPQEPPQPKLIVTVVAARGIRNSDWLPGLGKPDCYCVIKSGDKELFTTKILDNTLEPVWNEVAEIHDYTVGEPLEFSIYDKDLVGSDFLGRVLVESGKFEHGFNGEMQLDQAGTGIKAYLKFKIQIPGKNPPAAPTPSFNFTVEKGQHKSWGMDLDFQDGKNLQVANLNPGPVAEYNEKAAPELHLLPGDYIVSVNSVTGSSAMLDVFRKDTKVTIAVRREVHETFILNRKDDKTSFGADFPAKPMLEALVITSIRDGLLKEFNEKATDENKKFKVGDRIVAVAGFKGKAVELLSKMGSITGQFQLMISRPAPEDKSGHWRFMH